MNGILRRVGALTIAAGLLPSWGYFMSQWNPSDKGSRRFERSKTPQGAQPRRPKAGRKKKKTLGVAKDVVTRRNRKFVKAFDSSLGYPGEGPRRATPRRCARSRLRVIDKFFKKKGELVPGRRTSAERRLARVGISLREGTLAPKSRELYAAAFLHLWAWAQRAPPDEIRSTSAYDLSLIHI